MTLFRPGQPVSFKIPFCRNPRPQIKWLRGEELVQSGDRNVIREAKDMAVLTSLSPIKEDEGRVWSLEIENEFGADSYAFELKTAATLSL